MSFLVVLLLLALFGVTSTSTTSAASSRGGGGVVPQQQDQVVITAMRDMASNWNGFKNIFAQKAIVKFCKQGEATCQQGSFDDLFGPFQNAIKLVHVEHSILVEQGGGGSSTSTSITTTTTSAFLLHHWTQYVETHSGCQDTWAGYSSYEFDAKGKVERLVVYLEKYKEVLSCIAKATATQQHSAEAEQKKAVQEIQAATDF
jgi:hypothetical protein